jgi:hypothetical protein
LLVVPADVNEIFRLVQTDGGEGAEIHPQSAVAIEDEDFSVGERQCQAKTDGRAETEGFDLNISITRPNRVPLRGGSSSGGDEEFVVDQRRDRLKAFEALHLVSRL